MQRHDVPWTYYTIDNFFDPETWNKITSHLDGSNREWMWQADEKDNPDGPQTACGWYIQDGSKGSKKEENWYKPVFDNILRETCRKKIDYTVFNNPAFDIDDAVIKGGLIRAEPGYSYPIHPDSKTKIISIVVYVQGEEADGTIVVDPKFRDPIDHYYLKAIPNRAFIFQRNNNTLHWYRNTSRDKYRYTLNVYHMFEPEFFAVKVNTSRKPREVSGPTSSKR